MSKATAIEYKRKVYSVRDLPTLPVIAEKILRVADGTDATADRLGEIIRSDQSLTAKVLSLANSAYYGHHARVSTLKQAVVVIGTDMLKQLSLGVLVFQSLARKPFALNHTEFWKHSIATAKAASLIAGRAGIADSESCFISGLLHDVGKLVLDMHFPEEYRTALRMADETGCSLEQAEQLVLETDHCQAGAWLAQRWQLPVPLVHAIAYHHGTNMETRNASLVAVVAAANVCARMAEIGCNGPHKPDSVVPQLLGALCLSQESFQEIVEDLKSHKAEIDQFLSRI